MYCANCGTQFNSPFCPECGASAPGQPQNVERMPPQQPNISPVVYQQYASAPQGYQQPFPQQPIYQQFHTVIVPVQQAQLKASGITVAKTIIGILCMLLFFIIGLMSCSASIASVYSELDSGASSVGGFFVGLFYLIAGIISTAGRRSRGASIAAMIIFIITAIIGFSALGAYYELVIWALLAVIFAILYLIFFLIQKPSHKT